LECGGLSPLWIAWLKMESCDRSQHSKKEDTLVAFS
jgi:hypothetical protein